MTLGKNNIDRLENIKCIGCQCPQMTKNDHIVYLYIHIYVIYIYNKYVYILYIETSKY